MLDVRRPFTRADALAAGISPKLIRGSRFRRIFRGVYIWGAVPVTKEERIVAALLLHPPEAFASHLSAASLYGIAVPERSEVHISVTDADHRRWQPGLKPHVAPAGTETRELKGIRLSAPLRMFIELAAVLDLVDLVVAGDSMLRVLRMPRAALVAGLDASTDYWSPAARAAARFVREEVDSPMESRLRMLIVLAGLPEPTVNHTLRDAHGSVLVRFDLSYPSLRLIIEYDGRQHVEVIENWESDIDRREFLDAERWRLLKVTSKGIYVEPERTLDRIARALQAHGVCLAPRLDDWRPYFPGRRAA